MTTATQLTIEIACDHHEAAAFCLWLTRQGHDAMIGTTTGNYVDGILTDSDADASNTMNRLWAEYCND